MTSIAVSAGDLAVTELHGALDDPVLASMEFLNEVAGRYPEAISFAAGRPSEDLFEVSQLHEHLEVFVEHLRTDRGMSELDVRRTLYQYGRTKGVIGALVARNLLVDEGIEVDPESVVVTVGCQEAMFLVLRALRASQRDVLLAVAPTYVGLTGAARLVEMPVLPVATGPDGVDLDDLVTQVRRVRSAGLRPRACYVMPDFANPTGVSLDVELRRELLEVAAREGILLLEDNPYGLFHGSAPRRPTLKALDRDRTVVYLGSFAKTVLPGARVGYLVADQRVRGAGGETRLLADQLSKIKSMVTVNTSPIAQAVVGGKLLANDCSLVTANTRQAELYRRNLRRIVTGLARRFRPGRGVTWTAPDGGFFVVVNVPFDVDDRLLEHSARRHGVLWTPMSHFFAGDGGGRALRLSCGVLGAADIETGLDRLAALIDENTDGSTR